MSSIWMTVECFVVVKYLQSLYVHTVTFLMAYVLFSTGVKLFSHRIIISLILGEVIYEMFHILNCGFEIK